MKYIDGGVCAPNVFRANGIHCGVRKNHSKKDVSLIVSDVKCSAAAIYTKNLVKGSHIAVTKKHLSDGTAQAVICNSGNANTCNADGEEKAEEMCEIAASELGIDKNDVIPASTGVIGVPYDVTPVRNGIGELVSGLSREGSRDAALGIMTTDTRVKEHAVSFEIDGKECRLGGIAKGSGMIHPNLGTMLVFMTTDVSISPEMLKEAILSDAQDSFNMVSIDGDTSTNDMVTVLANGLAGNKKITEKDENFGIFSKALGMVTEKLCDDIASDGEGATRMIKCIVSGAKDFDSAKTFAKSVVCSSLVKAAIFGSDANWGRVLCALGYSGAYTDIHKVDLAFSSCQGSIDVCKNGAGLPFDEDRAKMILQQDEIDIIVTLHDGNAYATAKGCDLTYDYVKINGDYRT